MAIIIGHRGAAGLEPENTLLSFRRAIQLGVDAVECDVHLTRDGRVVVMHDPTVNRTTDGAGPLAGMSLAEIRRLDAGKGQPVPTLEEVLEAVRGRCRLLCEIKAGAAAIPAAEIAARRKLERDVTFISFALEHLAAVRRLGRQFRLAPLLTSDAPEMIQRARAIAAEAVGFDHRTCRSPALVESVHRLGLAFSVYTVNALDDAKAMLQLGADWIITDRPDILQGHLRALKQRGTKPDSSI